MKHIFSLIFSIIFYLSTPVFAELSPPPPVHPINPALPQEYIKTQEYINKHKPASLLQQNRNLTIAVVGTLITVTVGLLASNAHKGRCVPPKRCAVPN